MTLLNIILYFISLYFAFNILYIFVFTVAGLFKNKVKYASSPTKKKMLVMIPTYKEDNIIFDTAMCALQQNYPKDKFDVLIIADQLQNKTLKALSKLDLKLIDVRFEKSTKAKSLKFSLERLQKDEYDIVIILDADNVMADGCLQKINNAFENGCEVVQLHRTAKNRNTPTAILDAISEEINNCIFRRGHRILGLSSALIGSGMAFNYNQFRSLMIESDIENNPGEDREIYLELLKRGKICEYIEDAHVLDEKVQSGTILQKQRNRWISAQLQYAKRFWITEFLKTFTYNIHYFDYAVQTLLLPRVLLLGFTLIFAIVSLIYSIISGQQFFPNTFFWIIIFFVYLSCLLICARRFLSIKEACIAIIALPSTFGRLVKALLLSRADRQEFVHTPKEFIRKQ